jgi:hypothetical protein
MTTPTPSLIDRYARGAELPAERVRGLTAAELDAHPVPGTWSIRQLIVHLYESDMIATDRMRRIAAMERPLIIAYDQDAFIRRLHPERLDAELAAQGFAINRRLMVAVLRALPEEAFDRDGVHSERGLISLRGLVEGYCQHLDGHLAHLDRKLAALALARSA